MLAGGGKRGAVSRRRASKRGKGLMLCRHAGFGGGLGAGGRGGKREERVDAAA